MRKLDYFVFFSEASGAATSNVWSNNVCADTMTVSIDGTASAFSIRVQGLSDLNGTYRDLFCIAIGGEMTSMSAAKALTTNGIYAIDISGMEKIKVIIDSVTGGNVTVFGKITG